MAKSIELQSEVTNEIFRLGKYVLLHEGEYVDDWEGEDGGLIGVGTGGSKEGRTVLKTWKSSSHDERVVKSQLGKGELGISIVDYPPGATTGVWYTVSPDGEFKKCPDSESLSEKLHIAPSSRNTAVQEAITLVGKVISSIPSNP